MIPVEILNILNAIPGVNGRVYPLQATSNTPKPYIIYKQIEVLEGFSYEGEQRQDHKPPLAFSLRNPEPAKHP
jgi:hypothetical protein